MTFSALIIKFIIGIIAYAVGLNLFADATWTEIISFSLLMTVVSYLIGDRILLMRIGNGNALIADFLLSYSLVWIFGSVLLDNYLQIGWGSIVSAAIITVGEMLVHKLLLRTVPDGNQNKTVATNRPAYAMEIAKEHEPIREQ